MALNNQFDPTLSSQFCFARNTLYDLNNLKIVTSQEECINRLHKDQQLKRYKMYLSALVLSALLVFACEKDERTEVFLLSSIIIGLVFMLAKRWYPERHIETFIPCPIEHMHFARDNLDDIKAYVRVVLKSQYTRALHICNEYEKYNSLKPLFDDFCAAYKQVHPNSSEEHLKNTVTKLTQFVNALNIILSKYGQHYRYDIHDNQLWKTQKDALVNLQQLFTNPTDSIAPKNKSFPKIPVLRNISVLPPTLKRLLTDIVIARRNGFFIDERTEQQVQKKSSTPDMPGAIRCPHVNLVGALPDIDKIPTPKHAMALENHLNNHSKLSNLMASKATGQVDSQGYAEYTGTGILGDVHNCKIIFDYRQEISYVTLTHYKRWTHGDQPKVEDEKEPGINSAFFAVILN